ncbi:YcnI family protein [Streptomyces sp. B1866]|uniref:YcnI family copper-binding membrane protein n=1 Tax=Streptomyces sp. B1866 TaxID=3075431 RepID=UPI00288E85D6|nr:YcnI family protein [Streptomyces sp. B1866]MDT3398551.1 YcnI family protein [Streptomyces sp. B1866]
MHPTRVRRVRRVLPVPAARRALFVAACAAGAGLLAAAPALAHVTVQPRQADKGSYSVINFKVPNERDNAATVQLDVTFPADHPLTTVMPQPVPGWQVKVTKSKLDKPVESHGEQITEVVSRVVWSGGRIEPGTFQQFPVSVGKLPEDTDRLFFKALQTYSNKEVVRWIQEPREGQPEPDNPAPSLKLVSAPDEDDDQHGGHAAAEAADGDDGGGDTTARVLGVVGIVVGAGGVAFGALAWRRRTG